MKHGAEYMVSQRGKESGNTESNKGCLYSTVAPTNTNNVEKERKENNGNVLRVDNRLSRTICVWREINRKMNLI